MSRPDASGPNGRVVLVTGGQGQLAGAIGRLAPEFARHGYRVAVVGRPEFDFDRPETLDACFAAHRPALVVNAAAWTAVDAAEAEPEAAFRANAEGPARLAELCARAGIPLIQVSTDYVFDGLKGAPYLESDPTSPNGVYGASKRDGELACLRACPQAIVLRTSWVYGAGGKNFVVSMLNAARKTDKLRVVADQFGNPTAVDDLARAVLGVAARLADGWRDEFGGVFHATGHGGASWHELACETFALAARKGLRQPEVAPIRTEEWPTPAKRPVDSRLGGERLEQVFGIRMPDWRESLAQVVDRLCVAQEGA